MTLCYNLSTQTLHMASAFMTNTIQHILLWLTADPSGLNHLMQMLAVEHFSEFNIKDTLISYANS